MDWDRIERWEVIRESEKEMIIKQFKEIFNKKETKKEIVSDLKLSILQNVANLIEKSEIFCNYFIEVFENAEKFEKEIELLDFIEDGRYCSSKALVQFIKVIRLKHPTFFNEGNYFNIIGPKVSESNRKYLYELIKGDAEEEEKEKEKEERKFIEIVESFLKLQEMKNKEKQILRELEMCQNKEIPSKIIELKELHQEKQQLNKSNFEKRINSYKSSLSKMDVENFEKNLKSHLVIEGNVSKLQGIYDVLIQFFNHCDIKTISKYLLEIEQQISFLKDPSYNVLFIGEMSRGKSTIINAILGMKLSPERNYNPMSCVPVRFILSANINQPLMILPFFSRLNFAIQIIKDSNIKESDLKTDTNINTLRSVNKKEMNFKVRYSGTEEIIEALSNIHDIYRLCSTVDNLKIAFSSLPTNWNSGLQNLLTVYSPTDTFYKSLGWMEISFIDTPGVDDSSVSGMLNISQLLLDLTWSCQLVVFTTRLDDLERELNRNIIKIIEEIQSNFYQKMLCVTHCDLDDKILTEIIDNFAIPYKLEKSEIFFLASPYYVNSKQLRRAIASGDDKPLESVGLSKVKNKIYSTNLEELKNLEIESNMKKFFDQLEVIFRESFTLSINSVQKVYIKIEEFKKKIEYMRSMDEINRMNLSQKSHQRLIDIQLRIKSESRRELQIINESTLRELKETFFTNESGQNLLEFGKNLNKVTGLVGEMGNLIEIIKNSLRNILEMAINLISSKYIEMIKRLINQENEIKKEGIEYMLLDIESQFGMKGINIYEGNWKLDEEIFEPLTVEENIRHFIWRGHKINRNVLISYIIRETDHLFKSCQTYFQTKVDCIIADLNLSQPPSNQNQELILTDGHAIGRLKDLLAQLTESLL